MKQINSYLLLLMLSIIWTCAQAQQTVQGKVTAEGESLPFCTVLVDGTTNGTTSDIDGNFTINNVNSSDTLLVSFIGYHTKKIFVGNQTFFAVELKPDIQSLDEVIVVGFGQQKKVNVTGAVSSVQSEKLEARGVTNVSNMLAGQTPGLTVLQRGGSPGRNEGQIRIRGIGTLGASEKNDPLIIVDGIETGSLTEINPNDIESVSVLKDASASAIYGVRAANGVILITTKRGVVGTPKVNYSFQIGVSEPTNLPDKVNSSELAELMNEAQKNQGLTTRFFSGEDIDLFQSGAEPYTHANSDQLGEIFDKNVLRQVHNLSVSGGSENAQYLVSLGYTDEQGLIPDTGLKRYNFRSNLDITINKKLSAGLNLAGSQKIINDPIVGAGGIIHRAYREWATDPIRLENGNWAMPNFGISQGINHNATALANDGGYKEYIDSRFNGSFFMEYKPMEGLSIKGLAGTVQDFNRRKEIAKSLDLYNVDGALASTSQSSILEGRDNISDINLQLLVNYQKQIGNHHIKSLLGFNSRKIATRLTSFSALDLRRNNLDQINAADVTQDAVSGTGSDYRLLSYFGRLNYNYKEKYLLEANVRYDGTSRFASKNRYHLFPSFSAGWRVSEENFFNSGIISDLKARASWGRLGNQEIGNYQYLNTFTFDQLAFIGNAQQNGATEKVPLGNPDIIWETTEVTNVGLDISFFRGRLAFSGDYFIRNTSDVLIQKPLAAVFGAGTSTVNFPFVNAAATQNKGYELNIDFNQHWNDLKLSLNANFSNVKTEITDLAGTDQPGFSVGDPIANIYGYEAEGIFITQDEVDSHADQSALGPAAKPGDIKYKDINGPDGIPDGIINALDRKNLGSYFPQVNYGFSFRVAYKGFDISSVWQGVANVVSEVGGRQRQPFFLGSSPWKLHLDRATIDRDGNVANPEARYPRTLTTGNTKNYVTSSWWVESTAFLKLRNAQIGYTFPTSFNEKLNIGKLRIYVSGENLLIFTKFKGFDPEIPTSGSVLPNFAGNAGYPVTRTYFIGLNLIF